MIMNLSRRMQSGGFGVGLAQILQIYNKNERNCSSRYVNQRLSPAVIRFRRDYFSNNNNKQRNVELMISNAANNIKMQSSPPKPNPNPNPFDFTSWGRWFVGSVITLLLSIWNNKKMQKLKRIEGEAELIVEGVEAVTGMVEKVATATEEMAEEVAEKLPENSKVKEVALVVEHISEVAAHEAHLAHEFFHKVEKVTQDLDDLADMVEPFIDKTKEQANSESPSHPN